MNGCFECEVFPSLSVAPIGMQKTAADGTAQLSKSAARTPAAYVEVLRAPDATIEDRSLALEGLIKLKKQAAPARGELVMTLQRREWQLTWKALKALKTAGLCADCVSEIIDSIDVVAAAPSNKRHNLEAALNAAVKAAGAAVKSDLHKVMERVWLCQQDERKDPERVEADRSESNAIHMQEGSTTRYFQARRTESAAALEKSRENWAEYMKASAQNDADEDRQRVASGVLLECGKHVTDEVVAQVMANLQAASAVLRVRALELATFPMVDACAANGLPAILEAIARATVDADDYLRGEAAVAAGLLIERDSCSYKRPPIKLTPAQTSTLQRHLLALLDDPKDYVLDCVLDAMEDEFMMDGDVFGKFDDRKRRRPSAAQYRAAYLAKYPELANEDVEESAPSNAASKRVKTE